MTTSVLTKEKCSGAGLFVKDLLIGCWGTPLGRGLLKTYGFLLGLHQHIRN